MHRTLPLRRSHHLVAAVAALAAPAGAFAQAMPADSAANVVKLGVTYYDTHSKTNGVSGIGVPPGADVKTGDATTAVLTFERFVHPNIGIELAMGIPPKIKADAKGSVAFLGDDVLEARVWSPTLFANYHFFGPESAIRPYVGIGFNYTKFRSVKSRIADDVKLGSSYGLAGSVGVDWLFSKNFGLFASVVRIDVESKVVATGATTLTTKVDFRPWTYTAGLSYRF